MFCGYISGFQVRRVLGMGFDENWIELCFNTKLMQHGLQALASPSRAA